MKQPISITAISSISALGNNQKIIWQQYLNNNHQISIKEFNGSLAYVAQISTANKSEIEKIRNSDNKYKNLDDCVLYAIFCGRKAVEKANWKPTDNFGINIGSSRGATSLFEKYHTEFLSKKKSSTLSSPTTTLGNISSWLAHDLQTNGPEISHSITCSTALHSLLNGVAWINSGMSNKFLVGGSEAALTGFTVAQMQALKVYAKNDLSSRSQPKPFDLSQVDKEQYPCRSFDLKKKQNTMILGEGASIICLEKGITENAVAKIEGIGFATEVLEHNTSISTNAICFQKSMKMALQNTIYSSIDVIVMHTPGTLLGDQSEVNAIHKVFRDTTPFLTTNKWKLGHTFGASGMLSVEFALLMLEHQKAISVPFAKEQKFPKQIKRILVNAVGFGGNAVSVLITK